ncbi:MAG: hypothetical protein EAZ97_09125 [Bacteroidetes bacterium]|nr:MAG: hypothetical protein EAZ97_09125 [Bacteroidota bacterium]
MNPFQEAMVQTTGFHAVMSREVAKKENRIVENENHEFFYNPMWSFMGDLSKFTAGTYYYSQSIPICYFWNMFDQVLIRPSLIPFFEEKNLQILDSDGINSFLDKNNLPNKNKFSYHLPIIFSINY